MQRISIFASNFITLACLISAASLSYSATAQESETKKTVEPVFRVPKIKPVINPQTPATSPSKNGPNSEPSVPSQPENQTSVPANVTSNAGSPASFGPVARVADARPVTRVADARPVAAVPDNIQHELVPTIDAAADATIHPLDRAIEIAHDGLQNLRSNINDYTAVMVKRERVGNQLSEPVFMKIKIRNPRTIENRNVPFSIYMKFVKPRSVVGREVIWVEGQNSNKLIVHDTNPLVRFKNLHLEPNGFLAMKGNKYPIYEAGLEKLVMKLIEKAERDRAAGLCEVKYQSGAKINKRPCTLIELVHNTRCAPYEFHMAKVYIDDEYQIPVRFAAYDWPVGNQKPQLIEEYTYVNVALNVGLSDSDFDVTNRSYNFAR